MTRRPGPGEASDPSGREIIGAVIPLALVIGLGAGRWWAIPLAALAWVPLVLVGAACDVACAPGAAGLAAANAAVGVVVHKALAAPFRRRRVPRPRA